LSLVTDTPSQPCTTTPPPAALPRKLATQGAPNGTAPVAGELTYYAPWGNLAIFIEARSYARGLLPQPGPYQVQIERVED
jgi:hypothetical protein